MVDQRTYSTEKFPIYYEGVGEFKDGDGKPSGLRGSVASIEIGLNNRPHEIVGVRIRNSYARFPTPTLQIQDPAIEGADLPPPTNANWAAINDGCCLLEDLDDEQTVEIDLAQQNVIVRNIHQRTLCGKNGIHWHPFPCAYPFRGGNNLVVRLTRLQSYPFSEFPSPQETVIKPTAFVTVLGWMYVSDELPPGSPPSTDFNEPPQGATGYR